MVDGSKPDRLSMVEQLALSAVPYSVTMPGRCFALARSMRIHRLCTEGHKRGRECCKVRLKQN